MTDLMKDDEVQQRLLDENAEFRQLKEEHNWFHRKVEDLDKKSFLTPTERQQREELKKKKLALKDKMETIMAAYRRQQKAKG
jgi:uncharacterized protein YdcH (DUF465 family)